MLKPKTMKQLQGQLTVAAKQIAAKQKEVAKTASIEEKAAAARREDAEEELQSAEKFIAKVGDLF